MPLSVCQFVVLTWQVHDSQWLFSAFLYCFILRNHLMRHLAIIFCSAYCQGWQPQSLHHPQVWGKVTMSPWQQQQAHMIRHNVSGILAKDWEFGCDVDIVDNRFSPSGSKWVTWGLTFRVLDLNDIVKSHCRISLMKYRLDFFLFKNKNKVCSQLQWNLSLYQSLSLTHSAWLCVPVQSTQCLFCCSRYRP